MPSVDPGSTLRVSMKEYFETGLYSDLTITDKNGHEYAVHRSIVCGQSPVLAKACNPKHGFKEAKIGVIDLAHQDPNAVKAMLEFMYTGSYSLTYNEDAMIQIARVFVLGDMYCVSELKEAAAAQLNILSSTNWIHDDFANAVRIIYESVPSSGSVCALRQMVVSAIAEHYTVLLDNPAFQTILEDFGALGMDILRVMASRKFEAPKKSKEYRCPGRFGKLSHVVTQELELDIIRTCPGRFYCKTCEDYVHYSSLQPVWDD